jgi:hypothetical protein
MVCPACNNTVEDGARFCTHCGTQMATPASYPPPYVVAPIVPRVQRHLQSLGSLWCIFGIVRLVTGLLGLFVFRSMAWHRFGGMDWPFHHSSGWMAFLPFLVAATVVMAALDLFAGYGLLQRKPWARILAMVLAVLALIKFPLGTALGLYTLWVLAPSSSAFEYDAIADRD